MPSIASSESSTRGSSSTTRTVAGSLTDVSSRRRRSGRPPRQRQPDREGRPAARRALGADVAAVLLDDLVADREPQPGAFADGLRREEGIEDAAEHVGRDAGPGVADGDDGLSVLHARLERDGAGPG